MTCVCVAPVVQDAGSSLTFDDTAAHSEPTPLQRTPNMATPRIMGTVAPQTGAAFSPFSEVGGWGLAARVHL